MSVSISEKKNLVTCVLSVLQPNMNQGTGLPWQEILHACFPEDLDDREFWHYWALASIDKVRRAKGDKQFDVQMFKCVRLPFHEVRTCSHYMPDSVFRLRYFQAGEQPREHSGGELDGEVLFRAGEPTIVQIPEDHRLALKDQVMLGTWWLRRCAEQLLASAYDHTITNLYSSDCTVWKNQMSAYSSREAAERIKKFLDPFELQMLEAMEAAHRNRLSLMRAYCDRAASLSEYGGAGVG